MTKKIAHTARDQGEYMQLDGSLTQGGFIKLRVDGSLCPVLLRAIKRRTYRNE